MKTAILIDGGFYRRRAQIKLGEKSAKDRADELHHYCYRHLKEKHDKQRHELYRILYYDCPPMDRKIFHPFLNRVIDFSKSDLNTWMSEFLNQLKHKRKFALRMGQLDDTNAHYTIRYPILKKLMHGTLSVSDLTEADFLSLKSIKKALT